MDALSYVLVGAGGLLALARLVPVFLLLDIRAALFSAQIVKLCKAGDRDRAGKLCAAVPRSFFPRVVAATIDAAGEARPEDGGSLIRARLRGAFDEARGRELARARGAAWLEWLAIAAGAGGTAVALSSDPVNPAVAAAGGVATLLVVARWRKIIALDRAALADRDEIVEVIAATVEEGGEAGGS